MRRGGLRRDAHVRLDPNRGRDRDRHRNPNPNPNPNRDPNRGPDRGPNRDPNPSPDRKRNPHRNTDPSRYVSSFEAGIFADEGIERGCDGLHGQIVSAPLPAGCASEGFRRAWAEALLPAPNL